MGTILASTLIAQASEIVQDESNVVWGVPQALRWLNSAQRAIVSLRPDASVINQSILLLAGTKQAITGLRLMSITRNMGVDGLTAGRAIRLIERGIKDEFNPDWHTDTAGTVVKEYIYDIRVPKEFYVWPPVDSSPDVYVEVQESINPADVAIGDPITLDDIYAPAIIEWILYCFMSRDSEETPNNSPGGAHFQAFNLLLTGKLSSDSGVNPKVRAHLE